MKNTEIVKIDNQFYEILSKIVINGEELFIGESLSVSSIRNEIKHIILYFDKENNMYKPYKNQPTKFKKEIKLAIVGSRTFNDLNIFYKCIQIIKVDYDIIKIISGGARGADTLGEMYADENNISKAIYKPNWEKFGRKAGFLRNIDIIKNCDMCLAFWDGESHGTKHDLELCKEYNKICLVYNFVTGIFYKL